MTEKVEGRRGRREKKGKAKSKVTKSRECIRKGMRIRTRDWEEGILEVETVGGRTLKDIRSIEKGEGRQEKDEKLGTGVRWPYVAVKTKKNKEDKE